MPQENIIKRIGFYIRQHSCFGIVSFLLGLVELAYAIVSMLSIYEPLSWGFFASNLFTSLQVEPIYISTCCVFPILGLILGLLGLWIDQKKVFSVLGLALIFVSYTIFIAYILINHLA